MDRLARDTGSRSGATPAISTGRGMSRAAAHPIDYLITGNSVLVAELLKLLVGDLDGQLRRVVRRFRIAQAAQKVDEPLPVVCHETTLVRSTTVRNPRRRTSPRGRFGELPRPRASCGLFNEIAFRRYSS